MKILQQRKHKTAALFIFPQFIVSNIGEDEEDIIMLQKRK